MYPVFEIAANLTLHKNKVFITRKAKIISTNKYKTAGVPLILYNFVPAGCFPFQMATKINITASLTANKPQNLEVFCGKNGRRKIHF